MSDDIHSLPFGERPAVTGTADPVYLQEGSLIGKYSIVDVLGHGGMGVLYRAVDPALDRMVALKCPWRHCVNDPALRRFFREARAAARLSHPNIVSVYEVFEHDGLPWLALQLVRGRDLRRVLADPEPPRPEKVLRWASQLAAALASAHDHRILHRDIKPANILIDEGGSALLTDFGLARSLDTRAEGHDPTAEEITHTGAVVGTPAYMPPEQALGRPVDERGDVFSLGAVLYEACTRVRLIASPGGHRTLGDTVGGLDSGTLRPGLPAELGKIIRKAVAPDPDQRYRSARELAEDLTRCRGEWEAHRVFRRLWWQRPGPIVAGTVAVLILATAAIMVTVTQSPTLRPQPGRSWISTALITWPSQEYDGHLSPDGQWLSFVSDRDGQARLWIHSLAGTLEQPLTPPHDALVNHVWSPDGQEIAYLTDQSPARFIHLMPALGGPPRLSLQLDAAWRPDALVRWIGAELFVRASDGSLNVVDTRTGRSTQVTPPPAEGEFRGGLDVRPDGRRLVYSAGSGRRFAIWTSDLDGSNASPVTSGDYVDTAPRWVGTDGAVVVFTSNRSGQVDLWRLDLVDGSKQPITAGSGTERLSDASTDGTVLLIEQASEEVHLWGMNTRSGARRQLVADARNDLWPTLASLGTAIAFQRLRPRVESPANVLGGQILVGRLSDARLLDLRVESEDGYLPFLSHDGRWVAYLRERNELWLSEVTRGSAVRLSERLVVPGLSLFPLAWRGSTVAWADDRLYFVEHAEMGDRILQVMPTRAGPDPEVVVPATPRTAHGQLHLSDDQTLLAYVHTTRTADELRVRNLSTHEEHRLLPDHVRIQLGGWFPGGTSVLALVESNSLGPPGAVDVLEVDLNSGVRQRGAIERALAETAAFDAHSMTLYVTRSEDKNIHNLFAMSLDDGTLTCITDNEFPQVTFSSVQTRGEGLLVYTRQERKDDIWMLEAAR